ncbi:MAG TPA: methyltransferase domain-containing protein [Fibrobacteria bacterium]|nr:methyltransferase domain-containing protein [Fibrobacteria bacterium]
MTGPSQPLSHPFHPKRFDRAAGSYEAHSRVQDAMAETLIGLAAPDPLAASAPARLSGNGILELGCGTGLLTRRLRARFPGEPLCATDAAPRMLEAARAVPADPAGTAAIRWALMDASGLAAVPEPIAVPAPYGLAASNALVQWFPDLEAHFRLVASLLEARGTYLVSGFTPENFPELNAILRAPPFGFKEFPGNAPEAIRAAAAAAGFTVEALETGSVEMRFASAQGFLASIKAMGSARRPREGSPMTRTRLAGLLETYQRSYAVEGGVRATWTPWYARLRRTA